MDDELKVEQAKELIRTGKYLERVKIEGGTGMPKIVKLLSIWFKKKFGYWLWIYKKKKYIFFMKIKFWGGINADIISER